jgi:hypothetical protein
MMTIQKLKISLLITSIVGLSACAGPQVRMVALQHGQGGILAMDSGTNEEAHAKADSMMAQNCNSAGKKVVILNEAEKVVGTASNGSSTHHRGLATFGGFGSSSDSNSSTVEKGEWRIEYKCQ